MRGINIPSGDIIMVPVVAVWLFNHSCFPASAVFFAPVLFPLHQEKSFIPEHYLDVFDDFVREQPGYQGKILNSDYMTVQELYKSAGFVIAIESYGEE